MLTCRGCYFPRVCAIKADTSLRQALLVSILQSTDGAMFRDRVLLAVPCPPRRWLALTCVPLCGAQLGEHLLQANVLAADKGSRTCFLGLCCLIGLAP